MLCRSQNGPSALVPSQLLRNISFGLLYSWDAYCSSRELDINTVRDQLGHVSVNTTNYARPRSGQRKAKAIGTLRTRPNKKPSKHWSEHKGSCNLLTESLTLDQLCGGRAGASSSSCWLSERTPHNGNHNKTELLLCTTKLPIIRSTKQFCQGLRGAIQISAMFIPSTVDLNASP